MDRLVPTNPLGGVATFSRNGIGLAVLAMVPIAELRGTADQLAAAVPRPGLSAPSRVADYGDWRMLWTRTDSWLMIGQNGHANWLQPLRQLQIQGVCRITDMSHALAAVCITGKHARELLAKGTPLDLRLGHFGTGQCAHTWCAGFHILIEGRDEGLNLYVDAALAFAFWRWLADAATEFEAMT